MAGVVPTLSKARGHLVVDEELESLVDRTRTLDYTYDFTHDASRTNVPLHFQAPSRNTEDMKALFRGYENAEKEWIAKQGGRRMQSCVNVSTFLDVKNAIAAASPSVTFCPFHITSNSGLQWIEINPHDKEIHCQSNVPGSCMFDFNSPKFLVRFSEFRVIGTGFWFKKGFSINNAQDGRLFVDGATFSQ